MSRCISVLGSTGSIGRQTLNVAQTLGVRVAALTANTGVDALEAQCRAVRPELAVLYDEPDALRHPREKTHRAGKQGDARVRG